MPEKKKTNNVRTAKKKERTSFATHDGHALTPSEAKFIDEFLKTSNGRQSYITAYPNSNPKIAPQNANRLLNKAYINDEIKYRLELAKTESIASAEEVLQYFTDVMRGKVADQFGLEAPLSERTKAAQELAKRQIDIQNRGNNQPEITIKLDWGFGDNEE